MLNASIYRMLTVNSLTLESTISESRRISERSFQNGVSKGYYILVRQTMGLPMDISRDEWYILWQAKSNSRHNISNFIIAEEDMFGTLQRIHSFFFLIQQQLDLLKALSSKEVVVLPEWMSYVHNSCGIINEFHFLETKLGGMVLLFF